MAVYNLDINYGTLEYYPGKILKLYWQSEQNPHVYELTEEEGDALSLDEFNAYCAALDKFYERFWPLRARRYPTQMTPEKRREYRQRQNEPEIKRLLATIEYTEKRLAELGYPRK